MARITEHVKPFPTMPSRSSREFEVRRGGTPLSWPMEPDFYETVADYTAPYVVTVGFVRAEVPVPVEVAVRRTFRISDEGGFAAEVEPAALSARDVRRLPLDRVLRAAIAAADAGPVQSHSETSKILPPRGRPGGGERSVTFYKEIAEFHRKIVQEEPLKSPAKEIARRKRVPENTVHQWIYKARQHGFLEPSLRTRKVRRGE